MSDRKKKDNQRTAAYVIGMDLGGTKILAAVVDRKGQIVAEAKQKTKADKGPDAVIERIAETARQAAKAGSHRLAEISRVWELVHPAPWILTQASCTPRQICRAGMR